MLLKSKEEGISEKVHMAMLCIALTVPLMRSVLLILLRVRRIGFIVSVRPPFRMDELGFHWADFHEILYSRVFRKPVEKVQV